MLKFAMLEQKKLPADVEEKFPKEIFRVNREMRDEILVYDPFLTKFWTLLQNAWKMLAKFGSKETLCDI